MWRWTLRFVLVALLIALLAIVGGIAWLASDPGRDWTLSQLRQQVAAQGGQLEIASSRGSLFGDLRLRDLRLRLAGNLFVAERLRLHWRPTALLVQRLQVVEISGEGWHLELPVAEPTPPTAPAIPDIGVPLPIQLDRLDIRRLVVVQGETENRIEHVHAALFAGPQSLSLQRLAVDTEAFGVTGALDMQTQAPHQVSGRVHLLAGPSLTGPEVGEVDVRIAAEGPALRPKLDIRARQPGDVRAKGVLDLRDITPEFDLRLDWRELAWPLRGDPVIRTPDGHLAVAGTPDSYRLLGQARLRPVDRPAADVALRAHGDTQSLVIERLQVDALDGTSVVDGKVAWADGVEWALQLVASALDPGQVDAAWPGRIDASIGLTGSVAAGGGELHWQALIDQVSGQVRGYPLRMTGGLRQRGADIVVDGLSLRSGANQLDVDGSVGERLALVARIDAPQLPALHPQLDGALRGDVRLAGTLDKPRVDARLDGKALKFGEISSDTLGLSAQWRDEAVAAVLEVSAIDLGEQLLSRVDVRLDGTPDRHRIVLQIDGDAEAWRLDAAANGGQHDGGWQGRLDSVGLTGVDTGAWRLAQAVSLRLSGERVELGEACMVAEVERLCVAGRWLESGSIKANGRIDALDLTRLAPLLPGEAVVDGLLDAGIEVSGSVASPRLNITLSPRDGMVRFDAEDERIELRYTDVRAQAQFADDRGELSFNLAIGDNGEGRGRVSLGPSKANGRELAGEVRAAFPDLALLSGFVPALTDIQGGFQLAALIRGSTSAPRIDGRMSIDDARARVEPAGIVLDEIDLAVSGDGTGPLNVTGRLRSGQGVLNVSGGVTLAEGQPAAVDMRIAGEDFQVVRLPEATVAISPDLELRGSDVYRVTGEVRIPQARIDVKELPAGSVGVSPDEVIIGGQVDSLPAGIPASGRRVTGKVRVILGDDVSFKGFGLTTALKGVMLARFDERGDSVDGNIEMYSGRFQRFGQDLTIEQGRLLFAGPADNPEVDLRASRKSRDGQVTAYLAMSGPLKEPRPRVYSEPALPEGEALAYLVTGRGLDQSGGGDMDIVGAALALGISQGEPWLQDISERLGVDDLRVETGEDGIEDSSLLIGKYLNPDLYVGYTQELFNPEGAVLVRMRLNENLEVQTTSGRQQSVDLIFRHEHD